MPKRFTHLPALLVSMLLAGVAPAFGQPAPVPPPVPPPIDQLHADCARPQYASDTLVCADAALTAMDAEVGALAATPPTLVADAIWEDQQSWMRRRSLCAFKADHRGCLVAAYADRRSVLVAAALPATQPLRCNGAWQRRNLMASAAIAGQPIAIAENAALFGIATLANPQWQPALAWRAAGHGIKLKVQDGRQFNCRPAHP